MLLRVNPKTKLAERTRGERLRTFNLKERDLQGILFHTLDRLLYDDELLVVMQSRRWQEEPDLMALDKDGRLYIFELKAWEARSQNLLQALRYGQIFGNYKYDDLQRLFKKFDETDRSLRDAHKDNFGVNLGEDEFNRDQVFVVMTNGLDYETREAIQYWRHKLDIRPWVYRVYSDDRGQMLLEISPFAVGDNPYEDISDQGYYILNTDYRKTPQNHNDMLENKKAAAYFAPWKYKIQRLKKGDVVFLYQSGVGVVAVGIASGKLEKRPYHGNPQHPDEEYSMVLRQFRKLGQPVTASEIKATTGIEYRFMSTMFSLDAISGKNLYDHVLQSVDKP